MNSFKTSTLAIFLSVFAVAPPSHAATLLAPPIPTQVKQSARWFTGLFNNDAQVASNPTVPPISMTNCTVDVSGFNPVGETRTVYLEQFVGATLLRSAFYAFSEGNSGVELGVRRFVEPNSLLGLCDRPSSQRTLDIAQIQPASCDIFLAWQPNVYTGTNDPIGCPTSFPGGRVISDVEIRRDSVSSLDRIFNADGELLFGTRIEFQRLNSVPEASTTLALFGLGLLGMGSAVVRRKQQVRRKSKI
ncbi:MAG: chromophore lyase CpcT/CpeT [Cyanobacteriota bacterium]|nr:chromophore lyase CpcT/CpeT [Cyanobacteriota bacterium]